MKSIAAFAAFVLAAIGLQVAFAPAASAADIADAVTDVRISENEIENGGVPMRLNIDFALGAGIGRDGDVKEGDTFWVRLDPKVYAQNGSFKIYKTGSTGIVIADLTVTNTSLATITLTKEVEGYESTTGTVYFNTSFRESTTAAGSYDLTFTTANNTFDDQIRLRNQSGGGTPGGSSEASLVPGFRNLEQTRGTWTYKLRNTAAGTVVIEDDGRRAGDNAEWEFNCDNVGKDPRGATQIGWECTDNYMRWELTDVPRLSSGNVTLRVDFISTDPRENTRLRFSNTVTYTTNDGTPESYSASIRQNKGGDADGPTTPLNPTVAQSICQDGAPTGPLITLPAEGQGITYSLDDDQYTAGDTVQVRADLSADYYWDRTKMPDGWTIESPTRATLDVHLDDSPGCVLPVDPEVVQATCIVGTGDYTDPRVTPTDTDQIRYEVTGDIVPGGTAKVTGILKDPTGNGWDQDNLPDGWTLNAEGNVERSFTLQATPCSTWLIPEDPEIVQAACIAGTGDLTDPRVTPTDTAEIHYDVIGDQVPGGTVTVVGSLQNTTDYEWDVDHLPTGWTINADDNAERTITFDDPPCAEAISPVDPEIVQAVCIAGTGDLTDPTVTPIDTDQIHYDVAGDQAPGGTVTVTGTLQDTVNYEWDVNNLPDGWRINADDDVERTITLDDPPCPIAIAPENPEIVQATCIAGTGTLTDPDIIPANDDRIDYDIDGDLMPGTTVIVIASLQDPVEYEWDVNNLPDGWTLNADGDVARDVVLDTPPCALAVSPVNPEVMQSQCVAGDATDPQVTPAADGDGITYVVDGTLKPGASVQVVAALESTVDYEWNDALPDGWTLQTDGDATFAVDLDGPDCSSGLATTGMDGSVIAVGAAGGILLLGGLILMAVRARRREEALSES